MKFIIKVLIVITLLAFTLSRHSLRKRSKGWWACWGLLDSFTCNNVTAGNCTWMANMNPRCQLKDDLAKQEQEAQKLKDDLARQEQARKLKDDLARQEQEARKLKDDLARQEQEKRSSAESIACKRVPYSQFKP